MSTYARVFLDFNDALRLADYYKSNIPDMVRPEAMHITTAYTQETVDIKSETIYVVLYKSHFKYELFGNYLVLRVEHAKLHEYFNDAMSKGATWDFETFCPHITLCENFTGNLDDLPPPPDFSLRTDRYVVSPIGKPKKEIN